MSRIGSLQRPVSDNALQRISLANPKKEEILNYLQTTEEADITVRGLMAGSQSVTSFVLSRLQAANIQLDFKRQWQGASNINPEHPPLKPGE